MTWYSATEPKLTIPIEFFELQDLFQSEKIDLVICDSFAISCIDTAIVLKIPVMITATFGLFAGKYTHVNYMLHVINQTR